MSFGDLTTSAGEPAGDLVLVDVLPVLGFCIRQAAETSHEHVGTEHLALAAVDGVGGFAELARVSGLDPTQLGGALRHCCTHPRMGACDDEPRPTPRVVRLLAAAAQIAFAEGERELRAGHLVRVLLMEPGAVAWSGLARAGLSPAVVRAGIARLAAASPAEGRGHAN